MKEPYNPIGRSGWSPPDALLGNELWEAWARRFCKLQELGFVTLVVSVNLPKMVKPAMLTDL